MLAKRTLVPYLVSHSWLRWLFLLHLWTWMERSRPFSRSEQFKCFRRSSGLGMEVSSSWKTRPDQERMRGKELSSLSRGQFHKLFCALCQFLAAVFYSKKAFQTKQQSANISFFEMFCKKFKQLFVTEPIDQYDRLKFSKIKKV